jgi:hypothetical protein
MLQRTLTALITSALLGAMVLIAPGPTMAVRATGLTVDIYNAPENPSGMTRPWINMGAYTYCTQVDGVPNLALDFLDEGGDDAPYGTDCQEDNVLAHYRGTISIPETGDYEFFNASDDGLRVLLDSTEVLYDWTLHGTYDFGCGDCYGPTTTLIAGSYGFDAWWFDGCCGAGAFLLYRLNGGAWTIVPPEWFAPPAAGPTISRKAPNMLAAQPRSGVANASYLWYRCTLPGSESTSLPKGCRSTGVTSKFYRVTLQDKRSGYLRVFVRAGRDRYYSEAWSLSPVE